MGDHTPFTPPRVTLPGFPQALSLLKRRIQFIVWNIVSIHVQDIELFRRFHAIFEEPLSADDVSDEGHQVKQVGCIIQFSDTPHPLPI